MYLLSTSEALNATDSFLSTLYGDSIFRKWKELKSDMQFATESEYVSWLMDVANHYKSDDEAMMTAGDDEQFMFPDPAETSKDDEYYTVNIKSETYHSQYEDGVIYDPPDTEHSIQPSTKRSKHSSNRPTVNVEPSIKSEGNGDDDSLSQTQLSNLQKTQVEDEGNSDTEAGNQEITVSDDECEVGEPADNDSDTGAMGGTDLTVQRRSGGKKFNCPFCKYGSNWKKDVDRHISSVHKRIKQFPCDQCSYQCSDKHRLKKHIINKHGPETENVTDLATQRHSDGGDKKYHCQYCKYGSNWKKDVDRHISCVHKRIKPFLCDQCSYQCSDKHNLKKHIIHKHVPKIKNVTDLVKQHHSDGGDGDKKYHCQYCKYSSNWNKDVERHISSVHKRIKPFLCDQCSYQCSDKQHLKSHLVYKHGQETQYCCSKCDKYFPFLSGYNAHSCGKLVN